MDMDEGNKMINIHKVQRLINLEIPEARFLDILDIS